MRKLIIRQNILVFYTLALNMQPAVRKEMNHIALASLYTEMITSV